jgi:hypothetical protein
MIYILVEGSRLIRQIGQVAAGRAGAIHVQIKRRLGLSGEGYEVTPEVHPVFLRGTPTV